MGGLFLMTLFTLLWVIIAENALDNRDHRIVGILLGAVILIFIYYYLYFYNAQKQLSETFPDGSEAEKKNDKWFLIVFGVEGFLILLVKNILVNIGRDELFVPCFALIVGLHFIPLASLFKRKFDYYLAGWICAVAIIGLIFSVQKTYAHYFIVAFVGIGCAAATIFNGVRMILEGTKAIAFNKLDNN